jgi:sugar (pentulose or hexulose) kinase
MLLEDYIIMKFTGKYVSEKSLLSSTGYFGMVNDCMWQEMLDYIDVEINKFPEPM